MGAGRLWSRSSNRLLPGRSGDTAALMPLCPRVINILLKASVIITRRNVTGSATAISRPASCQRVEFLNYMALITIKGIPSPRSSGAAAAARTRPPLDPPPRLTHGILPAPETPTTAPVSERAFSPRTEMSSRLSLPDPLYLLLPHPRNYIDVR